MVVDVRKPLAKFRSRLVTTLLKLDRLNPQLALKVGLIAEDVGKCRLGIGAAEIPAFDVLGERARHAVEDHRQ
jgi:hypothetical protein